MKRSHAVSFSIVLGLLVPPGGGGFRAAQEEPPGAVEAAAAIYSLKVELELEKARLEKHLAAYSEGEARREELRDQISILYARMAALVRQGRSSEEDESPDSLEAEIRAAEQAEEAARENLRRLRDRITDAREGIAFLQEKVAALRRSTPAEPESLTGTWDVTYLPSGDRGVFTLRQSGTIVSGEYQQEGGWKGSLQGTLVNNKLVLHRIDSRLGAATDLEGVVSSDLKSIKGTWQNRVLNDGGAATGAWTGRKRESRKRGEGGGSP